MADEAPAAPALLSLSFDAIEPMNVQTKEGAALVDAADVPTLAIQVEGRRTILVHLTPEERLGLTEHLWQTLMMLGERHELIDPSGAYRTRLEASLTVGLHLYPDTEDSAAQKHPAGPQGAFLAALGTPGQRKRA